MLVDWVHLAVLCAAGRSGAGERELMHHKPAPSFLVEPEAAGSVGKANVWQAQCVYSPKGADQNVYFMVSERQVNAVR